MNPNQASSNIFFHLRRTGSFTAAAVLASFTRLSLRAYRHATLARGED